MPIRFDHVTLGQRVLFGADAFPSVLLASLKRAPFRGSCPVDALKLPHHGSRGNVSLPLLQAVPAKSYLISTNGEHFEHPDAEAIARLLVGNTKTKRLLFNYKTHYTQDWNNAKHKQAHKSHLLSHEASKRKRKLRGTKLVNEAQEAQVKALLPYA